jgi:ATP phosphoribosyltransferase
LMTNRLRVLEVIRDCQALYVRRQAGLADRRETADLDPLSLRLEAVLAARRYRYVMLHVPRPNLDALRSIFPGLASPTVLPLAGREDLVAVHFVVRSDELWTRLGDLQALGGTGIVALEPQALLP